jgi:hypothetical protein
MKCYLVKKKKKNWYTYIQLENVVDEMVACLFEKKEFRKPSKMTSMLSGGTCRVEKL